MNIAIDSKDLEIFEDGTTYYRDYCNGVLNKIQDEINTTLDGKKREKLREEQKHIQAIKERCNKALRNLQRFRGYEQRYFPQGIEIPINSQVPREV